MESSRKRGLACHGMITGMGRIMGTKESMSHTAMQEGRKTGKDMGALPGGHPRCCEHDGEGTETVRGGP